MKTTMKTISFFLFLFALFQISCKKSKEFIGYNDLVDDSPKILWGSSLEEVKNKYPNIEEPVLNIELIRNLERIEALYEHNKAFYEPKLDGKIKFRNFEFIDNKLFAVYVSYGSYSSEMLELLKEEIEKKYGKITTEDNGTIESWYIVNTENNLIVIVINKLQNNVVNCSYIYPPLNEENLKILYESIEETQ
jgi:hypothetical protein